MTIISQIKKVVDDPKGQLAIFIGIIFAIILLNARPGFVLMGLDNASPFFSFSITLHRIFQSENFFEFGGLFFSPALWLRFFPLPAWFVSQMTYWGAFLIGATGFYLLVQERLAAEKQKERGLFLPLIVALLLIGNLAIYWIFSQPILLFAPSFAGFPFVVLFLSRDLKKMKLLQIILFIIAGMYFFSTSINIIAFGLFLAQATVVALIVKFEREQKWQLRIIKDVFIKSFAVFAVWIIVVQALLLLTPNHRFIVTEAIEYGNLLKMDPKSAEVTESLIMAEKDRNSIINVVRYATGWVHLIDSKNEQIFKYKDLYDSPLFIFITLLPFLIFIQLFATDKEFRSRKNIMLLSSFGIVILLMSTYMMNIYQAIPYVRDFTRWISSKLWPIYFTLWSFLIFESLNYLWNRKEKIYKFGFWVSTLSLLIAGFPWFTSVVNSYGYVKFPPQYETFSYFAKTETVLYLPDPQKLYFRSYNWGYYGSDFLSYITKANLIDSGHFNSLQTKYDSLQYATMTCRLNELSPVTLIVFDKSLVDKDSKIPECLLPYIQQTNEFFTVIKLPQ